MKETLLKKVKPETLEKLLSAVGDVLNESRMQYLTRMKGSEMNHIHLYS